MFCVSEARCGCLICQEAGHGCGAGEAETVDIAIAVEYTRL